MARYGSGVIAEDGSRFPGAVSHYRSTRLAPELHSKQCRGNGPEVVPEYRASPLRKWSGGPFWLSAPNVATGCGSVSQPAEICQAAGAGGSSNR